MIEPFPILAVAMQPNMQRIQGRSGFNLAVSAPVGTFPQHAPFMNTYMNTVAAFSRRAAAAAAAGFFPGSHFMTPMMAVAQVAPAVGIPQTTHVRAAPIPVKPEAFIDPKSTKKGQKRKCKAPNEPKNPLGAFVFYQR